MADDITKSKAADFKRELIEVCRKHGLSIGHEDCHGAFLVQPFSEYRAKWLMQARIENER